MNEHTAFLRLAATAVDFPLESAEGKALSQHIDGCDACRRTADAFRMDATALRSLPRRSPSPQVTAAIMRAARGETRTGRPPLLLLGLGFLLVAGVAGAIMAGAALRQVLIDRQVPPIVAPSAAPSSGIVLPLPSAPQPSTDPRLGVEWQLVDSASDGPGGEARSATAVTADGPGFVAVGRFCSPLPNGDAECWAAPQVSSNGLSWEGVPRQPALEIGTFIATSGPFPGMFGVAARPGAIVAMGYAVDGAKTLDLGGVFRAAVWLSPDGRTWERIPYSAIFEGARFRDITASDQGFVIVGADYRAPALQGRPRGAIWTSKDGRAWQRVPDGPLFDVGGYLDTLEEPGSGGPNRVTAVRDGLVAAGAVCNDKGLDCRPAFWSSPDGSTWERVVVDQPNKSAGDVVETAGGYVAIGSASNATGCGLGLPPCTAVVFTSTDGRAWQQRAISIPAGVNTPDGFTDAVAIGSRLLAISVESDGQKQIQPSEPVIDASGANFWSSIDGVTWTPIEGMPPDYGPSPYQPLAAGPNRVVIVGDINARIVVSPKG